MKSFVQRAAVCCCWPVLFLLVVVSAGFSSLSSASDEEAQKLLKEFWSHTKKTETDAFFKTINVKTADVIYAYALVKSRQHDVQQALDAIDELHKLDDRNPQPWRLKTWLLLRQDRFNQAVVTLGKYIDVVRADKSLDDFNRTEAYRFAGRVFAYLDGPVKKKANTVTVDTQRRKVLFKLDADLLNAFTFDYSDVEDQYQKMMRDKQAHEDNFAKKDAVDRKIKFAQLKKVEEQLDETKTKLNEQSGDIRDEAKRELEEIRRLDLPLASQQGALESELSRVNSDLVFLISDYNYWNSRALRERNPGQRSNYYFQAGRIDGLIIQQELEAAQIRSELNAVQAERIALRRQYAETNAIAANQLASIEREMNQVTRQQRITSNQKIRTTKPTQKVITHSASLKTQAMSIVTYDQFPLEIERQLLLDKLK